MRRESTSLLGRTREVVTAYENPTKPKEIG